MSDLNVFGKETYFNENTSFFKDVYIYGNLYYDFETLEEFKKIRVNEDATFYGPVFFKNIVSIASTVGPSTIGIGTIIQVIAYDNLNSGTLSFEGSAGQLFSITNNLTSGSIFSVNDVSGIPSIDVDVNGIIQLAPYGGKVTFGEFNAGSEKLDIFGDIKLSGPDPEIEFNVGGPRLKLSSPNTLTVHTSGGLNTSTNEIVRINTTGVGIGTTSLGARFHVDNGNVLFSNVATVANQYTIGPYVQIVGRGGPTGALDVYPGYNVTCESNLSFASCEILMQRARITGAGSSTISAIGDGVGTLLARAWSTTNGGQWENAAQIYFSINNPNITGSGNHPSADIIFYGRTPANPNQYAADELARIEGSTGNFRFNSGYGSVAVAYGCRAWVQTGDGSIINGSGNITSVSEPLTTRKQINFATAMPDANYSVVCTSGPGPDNNGPRYATIRTVSTTSVVASFSDDASDNPVGITYWAVFR